MPKSANTRIEYSKRFEKQLAKAPVSVVKSFRKRRELFLQDPHNPQLHNHKLSGQYRGSRSINVTGDWRAFFREDPVQHGHGTQKKIIFELLGTHGQLYK